MKGRGIDNKRNNDARIPDAQYIQYLNPLRSSNNIVSNEAI
jgi:hypothetical protein